MWILVIFNTIPGFKTQADADEAGNQIALSASRFVNNFLFGYLSIEQR